MIGYVSKDFDVSLKAPTGLTDITITLTHKSDGSEDDQSPLALIEIGSSGIYAGTFQPDQVDTVYMTANSANLVVNGKTAKIEVQAVAPTDINTAVAGVNTAVGNVSQQITDGSTGFIM